MDVDRLLNLEKRTGVRNADIVDFERKVEDVEAAVRGLLDGSLNPDDVKVDGIETEEEKQQKEIERQRRLQIQREKEEQLRLKRKAEERDRWWSGAEIFRPKNLKDGDQSEKNNSVTVVSDAQDEQEQQRTHVLQRYTADYSKWEQWEPNDEATLAEKEELERAAEEAKNKEFEQNNSDFCKQFQDDVEQRRKASEKKQESADISRLKGNRFFKAKQFARALELYMDALKDMPFDVKTLCNIVQVHIKQKNYDDALEFIERTLYLDSKHIKALSRKAFVLGELGRSSEALVVVRCALGLEPGNSDLVAQEKELHIIEKERAEEKEVLQVATTSISTAAVDTLLGVETKGKTVACESPSRTVHPHAASASVASGPALVEQFKSLVLKQQQQLHSASGEAVVSAGGAYESLAAVTALLTESMSTTHDQAEATTVKVLMRTSGALDALIVRINTLCDSWQQPHQDSSVRTEPQTGGQGGNAGTEEGRCSAGQHLSQLILLLGRSIDQQRASKMSVLDGKVQSKVKALALKLSPSHDLRLLCSSFLFFYICGGDDVSTKMQTAIIGDKALLCFAGSLMGNIAFNCKPSLPVSRCNVYSKKHGDLKTFNSDMLALLCLCGQMLKAAAFHEHGQTALAALDAPAATAVVCGVAAAVDCVLHCCPPTLTTSATSVEHLPGTAWPEHSRLDVLEELVGASVGLSQIEALRSPFAVKLPVEEESNQGAGAGARAPRMVCLAEALLEVIRQLPLFATNALSALMNACLEPGGATAVREAVAVAGGAHLAILSLSATEQQRSKDAVADSSLLVRRAGLLSRLAPLADVQKALLQPDHYRLVCRRVAAQAEEGEVEAGKGGGSGGDQPTPWQVEERNHYVRVLASLSQPSPACLQAGVEVGVLAALLRLLPMPRTDCGEVTARSVTLMPADLPPALLLGNTARCLMPYADSAPHAAQLYSDRALLGVERLICAMASCPDMRVRRNIAILLAKGCRLPGVRERVTELRGMQMMIELQDKL